MSILVGILIGAAVAAGGAATVTIIGAYIYEAIVRSDNSSRPRRRLSTNERWLMTHFHKKIDLKEIWIVENARIRSLISLDALTISKTIFFKEELNECSTENMQLLLHELVHVEQYKRYGRAVFDLVYAWTFVTGGFQHKKSSIEKDALKFQGKHLPELFRVMKEICSSEAEYQPEDWFWLVWD